MGCMVSFASAPLDLKDFKQIPPSQLGKLRTILPNRMGFNSLGNYAPF
jgi:hypothetical protein